MKKGVGLKYLLVVSGLITLLLFQTVLATVFTDDEEYICWQKPVAEVWNDKGTPDADWGSLDFVLRNKTKWTYKAVNGADYFLHDDEERRLIAFKCDSNFTVKRDFDGLRDSCGNGSKEVKSRTSSPFCPEGYSQRGNFCYENGVSPSEQEAGKTGLKCPKGYDLTLKRIYQLWVNKSLKKEGEPRKTEKPKTD